MFDLTGGAFDVSIGTGLASLELDADDVGRRRHGAGRARRSRRDRQGYAVDLMAEVLEEWGLPVALVHGGFSSMLALEPPDGPRRLAADAERSAGTVAGARATHGAPDGARRIRRAQAGSHRRSATGEPVRGRRAAWVTLPRASDGERGAETPRPPRRSPMR